MGNCAPTCCETDYQTNRKFQKAYELSTIDPKNQTPQMQWAQSQPIPSKPTTKQVTPNSSALYLKLGMDRRTRELLSSLDTSNLLTAHQKVAPPTAAPPHTSDIPTTSDTAPISDITHTSVTSTPEPVPTLAPIDTTDTAPTDDVFHSEHNVNNDTGFHSVSKDDLDRVYALVETSDVHELHRVMREEYQTSRQMVTPGCGDSDYSEESSYSDNEMAEIERRKSEILLESLSKGKLYKDNPDTPWNDTDIENLKNDMEKQLLSLQQSDKDVNVSESVDNVIGDNLINDKSAENWDHETVLSTKEEMKMEMMRLLLDQQSIKSIDCSD